MRSDEIRKKLIEYKKEHAMSDFTLGLEIGLSASPITKIIKGIEISPASLNKIALFLEKENIKLTESPCKDPKVTYCKQANEAIQKLKQMLNDAHFENLKLSDKLLRTQNQYQSLLNQYNKLFQEVRSK